MNKSNRKTPARRRPKRERPSRTISLEKSTRNRQTRKDQKRSRSSVRKRAPGKDHLDIKLEKNKPIKDHSGKDQPEKRTIGKNETKNTTRKIHSRKDRPKKTNPEKRPVQTYHQHPSTHQTLFSRLVSSTNSPHMHASPPMISCCSVGVRSRSARGRNAYM